MRTFFAVALICRRSAVAGAQAQSYPSRPITLVAPTSPAGRRIRSGAFSASA